MGEMLTAYRDIIRKINQKEILIKELDEVNIKVSRGLGVQTSNRSNSVEDLVIKITEEKEKLSTLHNKASNIYSSIFNNIYKLNDDTYKTLLILRYLKLKSWGEIAKSLNYSKDYVRTSLHEKAKREYDKMFTNNHQ